MQKVVGSSPIIRLTALTEGLFLSADEEGD